MKSKLNPAQMKKLAQRRAAGATIPELAAEFGVGVATVDRTLKRDKKLAARKAKPTKPEPVSVAEGDAPPTMAELRSWLGSQVRSLRADAQAASPAARASANRNLLAAQALLTKVMPPEPVPESEGVFVTMGDMQTAADRARAKLHQLIDSSPVRPTEKD